MSDDFGAVGANGSSHTPGKHRGPRFSWTPAYEATFFRSLCESVNLGLREGSTFKQEAWDRAINALIKVHNAFAHKNHLINKSDNARKKFRLWRGLVEDPEFDYNPITRTVTASEDAWKRHIEVCSRCIGPLVPLLLTAVLRVERATVPIPEGPPVRTRRVLRDPLSRRRWLRRRPQAVDQDTTEGR